MNASVFSVITCLGLATVAGAAPGDVDTAFNPNPNDYVNNTVVQPDGKVVIVGGFTAVSGVTRNHIARLNPDGTLDKGFNPNANRDVNFAAVQVDGKIVIGGAFTLVGGIPRNYVARLNSDGSVDTGFNPDANHYVSCAALQPDGKLVIGGTFSMVAGASREHVARLHEDGTLDHDFNPNAGGSGVYSMQLQADGKVILGGGFTTVGAMAVSNVARLNPDGTPDPVFNPNASGLVFSIAVQSNGRVVLGGDFLRMSTVPRNYIARVGANGVLDAGFNPNANGHVDTLAVQANGRILMGGQFTRVGGVTRNGLARILPSGSLDTGFNANVAPSPLPGLLANTHPVVQADGKILIGGSFATVGGMPRAHIARLHNDAAAQSLIASSGANRVQWLRSGAAPEVTPVTFEFLEDLSSHWEFLGVGTRVAGGWELAGLSLPASGQVRARGRVTSGYLSASSGLIERVAAFAATPLELWRHSHFGTYENSGSAANNADPDGDAVENLIEFAFGLNPKTAGTDSMPAWQWTDGDYILSFVQPGGVSGITYVPEYSTTLSSGWTALPNAGTPPDFQFHAPASERRVFLRVRVTVP